MKKLILAILLVPLFCFASGTQPFVSTKIIDACSMAGTSCTSTGILLDQYANGSIQIVSTGSPNGSIKMQVSNDKVNVGGGSNPASNVVNWVDYTPSITTISTPGPLIWNIHSIGYRWIRVVYTKVSGSGTLNVIIEAKGI